MHVKTLFFKANAFAPMNEDEETEGEGKQGGIDDAHELNVSMEATPGGFDLVRWGNIGVNGDVAFFHSRHEACDARRMELVTQCAEALHMVRKLSTRVWLLWYIWCCMVIHISLVVALVCVCTIVH
jgi:hypothetical protein